MFVAMAAPATPNLGNGPMPKINNGPRTMLIEFASQSTRIAIAASPAPRKTALIMKSMTTVTFPANMIRVNVDPRAITVGDVYADHVGRERDRGHALHD